MVQAVHLLLKYVFLIYVLTPGIRLFNIFNKLIFHKLLNIFACGIHYFSLLAALRG